MKLFTVVLLMLIAAQASAQLRLPAYFADNMVLQRNEKVNIWGWSKPQQEVTVTLANKQYHCITGPDSIWHVNLPKMPAGGPYSIELKANTDILTINKVYFGDVWFCSGQSNMSFRVSQAKDYDSEVKDADYPLIRQFDIGLQTALSPQKDVINAKWTIANANTIGDFSAVAWFFAKEIFKKTRVPIAIIHSSWGGTPIEAFMNAADLQGFPLLKKKADLLSPKFIHGPETQNRKNGYPTLVYNAMIAPFFNYPVKGVLWYQGEANSDLPLCFDYEKQLALMINSWRRSWGNKKLPFLIVQLANYNQKVKTVTPVSGWAIVQEAQFKVSQSLPHVGISITNDIGNPFDAHPKNKQDVGKRMAAVAFREVYGDKKIIASGPTFSAMAINKGSLTLSFKNIGGGLTAKGGGKMLHAFSIAGSDNKYHTATAKIMGDKVVVFSNKVSHPINVRYAFESNPPTVNFYNIEGFPAAPFRTDEFTN